MVIKVSQSKVIKTKYLCKEEYFQLLELLSSVKFICFDWIAKKGCDHVLQACHPMFVWARLPNTIILISFFCRCYQYSRFLKLAFVDCVCYKMKSKYFHLSKFSFYAFFAVFKSMQERCYEFKFSACETMHNKCWEVNSKTAKNCSLSSMLHLYTVFTRV